MKCFGIDGCPDGWLYVMIDDKNKISVGKIPTINDIFHQFNNIGRIFIDIPIGMVSEGENPRECDNLARKFLRRIRSSSVFPPPCRAALYAMDYSTANHINRMKTGKGLSKQAWNISPKIRDIDQFLIQNPEYQEIVIESHPELCFYGLNGGVSMKNYKKSLQGKEERLSILKKYSTSNPDPLQLAQPLIISKDVSQDDVLDAWVLAISAIQPIEKLCSLPNKKLLDEKGFPMRIVFPLEKEKK